MKTEFLVLTIVSSILLNTNAAETLQVSIVAHYNSPLSFTRNPPYYRAASPLTLSCEVEGQSDPAENLYEWSSTCTGACFTRGQWEKDVTTDALHSYDTGVHTCTVSSIQGSGSANISVNVVGAGVYVTFGKQVLSNHGLIVANARNTIPSFWCLSGSSSPSVGKLISPLGNDITLLSSDNFLIRRGNSYDPGNLFVRNGRSLQRNEVGIYTYRTPDENGKNVDFNFGLYYSTSGIPICTGMDYSLNENVHTLTCNSSNTPPTEVIWEKDGERIYSNDTDYSFTQTLINRKTSVYTNVLSVTASIDDVVGDYSCRVVNNIGSSSPVTKKVEALEISGHETPVLVGLSRDITCTTHLNATKMEWILSGVSDPVEQRDDGEQTLILPLNPTTTGLDGARFTCRVTTASGKAFEETISVQVREFVHTLAITGPSNPLVVAGAYLLTCTVVSHLPPNVKWLDPDDNDIDVSDNSAVMMQPVTRGNTTTVVLNFNSLKASHAGSYSCVSTVTKPSSFKRMRKHIEVKLVSDSVSVTRSPSTGIVYTASSLTLTCFTKVNQAVDIPTQVRHQWSGPNGAIATGNGVTISGVTGSQLEYTSTVTISYLSSSHSGSYVCSSTVLPAQSSVFIANSAIQTASTQFTASIRVTIEITYTSPDVYPVYSPPNYRAASGPVTLRCVAAGTSGSVTYQWSSTCSSCFARSTSSQTISESFLRSRDVGTHTCSVRDGNGNTGSGNTTMNIVDAGVYLSTTYGSSTGSPGTQPTSGYAKIRRRHAYNRLTLFCCSNTTTSYTGSYTFPNGGVYTSNTWNAQINRYSYSNTYAGCIQLHYYTSYSYNMYLLRYGYGGIYTCNIPDNRGNTHHVNFGLYDESFTTAPSIYNLRYSTLSNGSIQLTCQTRNSALSAINWYKNGNLLDLSSNTTYVNVTSTNRQSTYYQSTLTICDAPDRIFGNYSCSVSNNLGSDSEIHSVEGLVLECSRDTFVVGETTTCRCYSDISSSGAQWYKANSSSSHLRSQLNTTQTITVETTTDDEGLIYICSLSSACGMQEKSVSIATTVPDDWATVEISSSSGQNALNNTNHALTCSVRVVSGMNLPARMEWVGPDGAVVRSEGNRTVGEVQTQGTLSTLTLSFHSVYVTDAGSYTCRTAVTVPWMSTQPPQLSVSFHMPVTTQAMFQLKLYPLTHCSTWNEGKASDLEYYIKREVEQAVSGSCNCLFSSSAIYAGEFSCQYTSCKSCDVASHVTYRAILNGTSDLLHANQLMQHLQNWRSSRNTLLYNSFRLRMKKVSECKLNIDSFEEEECT